MTARHLYSAHLIRTTLTLSVGLVLAACAVTTSTVRSGDSAGAPIPPEAATGFAPKPGWTFAQQVVAAANPLAADAGLVMLRAGGSAVDAAIAVQMVLTLVEPQSSGIGGGAFLLHFDGQRVQAFDGRETAPAVARPDLFMGADGQPLSFMDAVASGRSVGTPGAVAMLALAHRQHGRLPWARLFEPAIALADQGFAVSPRLHGLLAGETALQADPVAAAYFYRADGTPHPVGHVLKNPELAAVLRDMATVGPLALHDGPVARAIVARVRQHPRRPGTLSLDDLKGYTPKERAALCFDHTARSRALRICGFPPPSSGAVAIGQIMGLLARTPPGAQPLNGVPGADWLHAYTEASRLAFADRAQYLADPDFVTPPAGSWASLLAPHYLDERARLITTARAPQVNPGQPAGLASAWAPMPEQPEHGTSHISIVDRWGNALAMTTTIEAGFGARLMVNTGQGRSGGFLLNNQLTDFSFAPTDAQGRLVANRVEPGKRPRSSMSPTLVFDALSGQLLMSAGSPGGALIIHFTAKTLLGALGGGLSPQAAIDLPNFGTTGGPVLLEALGACRAWGAESENRPQRGQFLPDSQAHSGAMGPEGGEKWTAAAGLQPATPKPDRLLCFPAGTVQALRERGHTVKATTMTSGLQAIQRGPGGHWQGGADPRREGVVVGD